MNILQISNDFFYKGGDSAVKFNTSEILRKNGHNVIDFSSQHPKNEASEYARYFSERINTSKPRPVDVVRFFKHSQAANSLRLLLNDVDIDIAHVHTYGQFSVEILKVLRAANIPIVQTVHEYLYGCPVDSFYSNGKTCTKCINGTYYHALLGKCNKNSLAASAISTAAAYYNEYIGQRRKYIDHFITVSDFLRQKMLDMGFDENQLTTIHNPLNTVNVADVKPLSQPGKYVLYFGRLEPIKGLFTLLETARRLKEIQFWLIGTGGQEYSLLAYCKQHNITNVKFLGYKHPDELKSYLKSSTFTILPSEGYETFGLAVLESFQMGKTVVASRIGGITEIISQLEDGVLFEPGNIDDLTEKVALVYNDDKLRAEFEAKAQQKVANQFTHSQFYDSLIHIYTTATKK